MPKNPIDPKTGKPRKGRPPKVTPIDTIAGPQPTEEAVKEPEQAPVFVTPTDPSERATTALMQEWKDRHKNRKMLDVPEAYRKAYPDGDFCYARSTAEGISEYMGSFDYEIAKLPEGTSLPGQTDSTFKFHDVVLMVRPKWMRQAQNELDREKVLEQLGKADPMASLAEREAYRDAGNTVQFLPGEERSDSPDDPGFLKDTRSSLDGETPALRGTRTRFASTGTKYVRGGIPT